MHADTFSRGSQKLEALGPRSLGWERVWPLETHLTYTRVITATLVVQGQAVGA